MQEDKHDWMLQILPCFFSEKGSGTEKSHKNAGQQKKIPALLFFLIAV
jgi:hypothetical protein